MATRQTMGSTMYMVVDQLGEVSVPELRSDAFDDVASKATLTIKETAPGHKYYWQWNQDGQVHTHVPEYVLGTLCAGRPMWIEGSIVNARGGQIGSKKS